MLFNVLLDSGINAALLDIVSILHRVVAKKLCKVTTKHGFPSGRQYFE